MFEKNTIVKKSTICWKGPQFVQKNHPVEVSGYGPEISKDILFIYHDKGRDEAPQFNHWNVSYKKPHSTIFDHDIINLEILSYSKTRVTYNLDITLKLTMTLLWVAHS